MPASRLTVRTLCLATVALVLACGHAARAMGVQRATPDRAVTKPTTPARTIRVVPAGSGQSTVATFSNSGSGGGGRSSASRVATFTSASGSSGSVATFSGDRVLRQASAANHRTPPARTKPRAKLLPKGEPPIIAVRRAGAKPDDAMPTGSSSSSDAAPAPGVETAQAAKSARPAIRNAFGGLSSAASSETMSHAPLVYAQAYSGSR